MMSIPRSHVSVDVDVACDGDFPAPEFVEVWVGRAVNAARDDDCLSEVSVRIVEKDEIRALNRDYRQRDYVTNVLSFPAGTIEGLPAEEAQALGDVVVCAAVVAAEAAEQGKSVEDHWAHMLVHGMLHLQGYDHVEDTQADQMEALEIRLLSQLGYSNPYLDCADERVVEQP